MLGEREKEGKTALGKLRRKMKRDGKFEAESVGWVRVR